MPKSTKASPLAEAIAMLSRRMDRADDTGCAVLDGEQAHALYSLLTEAQDRLQATSKALAALAEG